jgi:hypothetical protein
MPLWTGLMDHEFLISQVDVGGVFTRSIGMGAGTPLQHSGQVALLL